MEARITEKGGEKMICPYFWHGGMSKTCEAYADGLVIPSINEGQDYCVSSNY